MAKKLTTQALTGDAGIATIHRYVNRMGFAWHELARLDVGIDGQIELSDPTTGDALNRIIRVQSKASDRPFPGEDDHSFHLTLRRQDVDYWLQSQVPVIVVVSRPATDEAWFVCVQDWFATRPPDVSTRVSFSKSHDRFDEAAADRLLALAAGASRPLGFTQPVRRDERLISNLLPLTRYPDRIHHAESECRRPADAWELLRDSEASAGDWLLTDGRVYSFRDLTDSPAGALCAGPVGSFSSADWALSPDRDRERRFVALLNQTLRERHRDDLRWHRERHYFYFRATPDLEPRKIRSGRGEGARTVFNRYLNKRDPRKTAYYRHAAFERSFVRIDDRWFLEIVPTYHYTYDGERESHYAAEYLRKIKARERNAAVRDQLLTLARYLRGETTLLHEQDSILTFGDLETFDVSYGVDDDAWARNRRRQSQPDPPDSLFRAA